MAQPVSITVKKNSPPADESLVDGVSSNLKSHFHSLTNSRLPLPHRDDLTG